MDKYLVCVEIGGTNLRYGIVDTQLRLLCFHKTPTQALSDAEDKIAFLSAIIEPLLKEYGRKNILCISMALASLMDKERTTLYSSPMVRGFDNIAIVHDLSVALKIPVIIEKDVNILLLYEISQSGRGREGIISGVFLGTGLGNAMCIDGRIYKGSNGVACELGHIPVLGLESECGCGKKGCIELLACGRVLQKLASGYGCPITELFSKHSEEADVRQVVYAFAVAIATEITILDPAYVILGGGVVEMEGFPLAYLKKSIAENLRIPNPREALTIVPASGDEHAGVVGAAIYAMQVCM